MAADKRGEIGEAREETLIVGNDRGDLGLLEHDLRQPDAVRIARILPGQIVAAVATLPRDDAGGEVCSECVDV